MDFDRDFFSRRGYAVIHDVIPRDTCEYLVKRAWELLPSSWDQHDPSTWSGPVVDSCHSAGLAFRRGHLKFQKGFLNDDCATHAAVGPGSPLGHLCAQLLGGGPIVRYRGLYLLVPFAESRAVPQIPAPHVEAHPVQVVSTAYLNDVSQGHGGLLVWPGSHRDLYPLFDSKMECLQRPGFAEVVDRYRRLEPLELLAPAGSVILLHHRLLHAPSVNQGNSIRFALFTDFMSPGFKDLATQPPGHDPWEDWPGVPPAAEVPASLDHSYRPVDPRKLKGLHIPPENHTVQNKLDASRQIRAMKDGELWLVVSDRSDLAGSNRVEPCGERMPGLVAIADGRPLVSTTANDLVARIPPGTRTLELTGGPPDLWVRLVLTRLPYASSRLLVDRKLVESGSIQLHELDEQ